MSEPGNQERGSSDVLGAIFGIALGIVGGIALAALLNALLGPRCPVCQRQIQRGISMCPYCRTYLQWQ